MHSKIITALFLTAFVMLSGLAFANEDDTTWISKCMEDNKKEGVSTDTIMKYCKCMNDKMSSDETQSITEWEKTHKKEMADCDKQSGWVK